MTNHAADWVAVIDDDNAVRRALARYFKTHRIPAELYRSVDEYLDRPPGDLPRCIMLDLQLATGRSAFDLLDRMDVEGTRVPVIFVTGQGELQPELCERYPELRTTLRKPFDPEHLIALVRYHLQASRSVARPSPSVF